MTLVCEIVANIEDLTRIRPEWEALLGRSDCNELSLSPLWLFAWWRVFGPVGGREARVGVIRDGERLVGIVPLVWRVAWHRSFMPFRRLEAMPSGELEEDEIASDYIGAVIERGAEARVCEAFASALAEGAFGAWDELVLPAMDGTQKFPLLLADSLRDRSWTVAFEATGAAPYIPLPSTYEAYLASLSSSRRYLVNRSLRDFERWAGEKLSLRAARTQEDLEGMRETLARLHEARWQTAGKEGVFGSRRFSDFHAEVMTALLERGALSLTELWAHGEPVASLYSIVWNQKVYFYQSGRKPDLPSKLRPGIVAHALAIRAAIEGGLREYDFLNGNSRYKEDLALASRPIVKLRAARSSLREGLRGATELGIDHVRSVRKAVRRAQSGPDRAIP